MILQVKYVYGIATADHRKEKMEKKIRHYVAFYCPGILMDEATSEEVETRDQKNRVVPNGYYGYRYYDIMESIVDGIEMKSDEINKSGMYYQGARILTTQDVQGEDLPERKTKKLIEMIDSGKKLIKVRTCGIYELKKGDKIV